MEVQRTTALLVHQEMIDISMQINVEYQLIAPHTLTQMTLHRHAPSVIAAARHAMVLQA